MDKQNSMDKQKDKVQNTKQNHTVFPQLLRLHSGNFPFGLSAGDI